jgi:predicted DNA-binding transcriptional regulator YafY
VEVLDEPVAGHAASQGVPPVRAEEVRLRVAPRSLWLLEGWDITDVAEEPDGCLSGVVHVADREWLTRIVLGQGGGVEVLSPPDLRSQVRAAAAGALESLTGV